jgi:tRNA-Thr(GGU) m(6)t(6)A37 methyltransferase TsaA
VIRTPHHDPASTPIQPVYALGIPATVEVFPNFEVGLQDLDGFSHIHLLYAFHCAGSPQLVVTPFLDDQPRGVFATRSPSRPNPIGISLVRLVGREGRILRIEDVDILDGTPLLDIKPYSSRFDVRDGARCGWQDRIDEETARRRGRRGFEAPGGA